MYDAIDDPYAYPNSTVLMNKRDLRDQVKLDAFEAEITNARAAESLPVGDLDFAHFARFTTICFRIFSTGPARLERYECPSKAAPFVSRSTFRLKQTNCFRD